MSIAIFNLTDSLARHLRRTGWIIKSPRFIHGQPVFTAIRRG
ncbi:hypothetical protein [Chromobacterium violaceum]|nr:hypothetical protein [Chromobacterium violaceum]